VEEYENIYYQRRPERLHFCRPCLHTLLHTAPEITRVGPGTYSSQYTMERAIGDLGKDIHDLTAFANLCQIAVRRSQLNALKTIFPELDPNANLLPIGDDIGNGYFLLAPREKYPSNLHGGPEWIMIHTQFPHMTGVQQWGRLKLPNGQIFRSLYSETQRKGKAENTQVTRNVKVSGVSKQLTIFNRILYYQIQVEEGKTQYGKVQFFFYTANEDPEDERNPDAYALVSFYGPRDEDMQVGMLQCTI